MSRIIDTIRRSGNGTKLVTPEERHRKGKPEVGVVSYFHMGDHGKVERGIENLELLGVKHLRTAVSWCDWTREGGVEWYEWVLPQLIERFDVLPCVVYTPPELGILPKTSSPPRDPEDYGRFVELLLKTYDGAFSHVELWNEPNNYIEWDWTVDPEWVIFADMVRGAAERAAALEVKTVLGGMSPLDPNWLDLMFKRGAMDEVAVLGIHGFPGTWEAVWEGWDDHVRRVEEVLDKHSSPADVWVTESGFSTWAHDDFRMIRELVDAAEAPVPRVYWYCAEDLAPEEPTLDGFHADERAYHFGLFRRDGTPKLAARLWTQGGLDAVRQIASFGNSASRPRRRRRGTLITGGAGFIGTNLADRLATEGKPVTILDNLARPGVERNFRWLVAKHGDLISTDISDVRDRFAIRRALQSCDEVFHLAAQVAVTTSVAHPVDDFEINVQGAVNVLEELRRLDDPPPVVFTSTNKVYGSLADIALDERDLRYEPIDPAIATTGISEDHPLAFCSPYGCSKGAADQYFLDYARSFGLRTAVFRMSCIYGPHQFGTEDQGWVAHFLIQALKGAPITIYGDGKQIRDLLFVDDLVSALLRTIRDDSLVDGRAFNIGGGIGNSVSVREVLHVIQHLHGSLPEVRFADWRIGDQRYYVSGTGTFSRAAGWTPRIRVAEGIERLYRWLKQEAVHEQDPTGMEMAAAR